MTRYPNWDTRLNQYIREVRDQPFEWGAHDCLTFANSAVVAQTGQGFADQWIGKAKTARDAIRLYRAHIAAAEVTSGPAALDKLLRRVDGWPSRGDITGRRVEKFATGYALGVCLGNKIAFPGWDGLQFFSMEKDDLVWAA